MVSLAQFISAAQSQIGVPYVYGGESPSGFDCSGLVQWAASKVGLALPRTAQAQYQATLPINTGGKAPPAGSLVFFGTSGNIHHVGISVGNWLMIDAPNTGARVRVESFRPGTGWDYFGATDPTGGSLGTQAGLSNLVQDTSLNTSSASLISSTTSTLKKVTFTALFLAAGAGIAATGLYRGVQSKKESGT